MTWLDLREGDVMAVMCDQDFLESAGYGPAIGGLQLELGRGECWRRADWLPSTLSSQWRLAEIGQ